MKRQNYNILIYIDLIIHSQYDLKREESYDTYFIALSVLNSSVLSCLVEVNNGIDRTSNSVYYSISRRFQLREFYYLISSNVSISVFRLRIIYPSQEEEMSILDPPHFQLCAL